MQFHKNRYCNQAMIQLMDALCTWERTTGRESTLIFVPQAADEKIVMAQNGKILPDNLGMEPKEILDMAMKRRK